MSQATTESFSVKIAACVTLYNSSLACIWCIETYCNQVQRVYVIDNSTVANPVLVEALKTLPNTVPIFNGENKGVASALNQAAELAIADGFDYLLTMDDDTKMPTDCISTMLRFLNSYANADRVGIVSGIHNTPTTNEPFTVVPYTMTSGNLLNLHVYKKIGPFRDDLFIDHVDHEYGLRLTKAGYEVIELPALLLAHKLGERKPNGWGGHTFISHTPLRTYYIVRNGLEIARQYPTFRRRAITLIGKEWLKTILFEENKLERFNFLLAGLRDGFRGKLGKYNQH